MVYPVRPYPFKKLDGTWVWIDPKTNKEITMNEQFKDLDKYEDIRGTKDALKNATKQIKYWIVGCALVVIISMFINVYLLLGVK